MSQGNSGGAGDGGGSVVVVVTQHQTLRMLSPQVEQGKSAFNDDTNWPSTYGTPGPVSNARWGGAGKQAVVLDQTISSWWTWWCWTTSRWWWCRSTFNSPVDGTPGQVVGTLVVVAEVVEESSIGAGHGGGGRGDPSKILQNYSSWNGGTQYTGWRLEVVVPLERRRI